MLLPTGTVTFLLTDIAGSTTRWENHPEAMAVALARHDAILRQSIESCGGYLIKSTGDGVLAAFHTGIDGLNAALSAQQTLQAEPWPEPVAIHVRMGLHAGTAELRDNDYFGLTLNRTARLMSVGHGGQLLLSAVARELCRDDLPSDTTLRNLGEHRLKDLSRPETIYQVVHPALAEEFPALRTLDNPALPNNLPHQITSFIGREKEIEAVTELLEANRLLTLTGAGGCGKTRLSLQVAAGVLEQYPDGVWLIELAPLSDPALVAQVVVKTFGIMEKPGQTTLEALTDHLKTQRMLLVLDNCEHLLDACAALATALLRSCPDLHLLATSREHLGIAGERIHQVSPLTTPNQEEAVTPPGLDQYESVRLFIERALLHRPDFAVTNQNAPALAQLCHRLDGIPLALELAAARIRSLSVEDINNRLDHRFHLLTGGDRSALPRQQTLRALVDWSYDLLNEDERILFARLSIFSGGWTLEAAEQVCGFAPLESFAVLDLLTSLVDKSLVLVEEGEGVRYQMLETLRQYAAEKQERYSETETIRVRHLNYFLALAEEAEPQLRGSEQPIWLTRLETEHDNLRAALAWSASREEETGLRLVATLPEFWMMRGFLSEGRNHLAQFLNHRSEARSALRAKVLKGAGILAWIQCDFEAATMLQQQCLTICRELEDKTGIGNALNNLGNIDFAQGNYHSAQSLYEQSLVLYRELRDTRNVGRTLNNLGSVAIQQGDYARAQSSFEESLAIARERGEKQTIATVLSNLGDVLCKQNDYESARLLLEESLTLCHELGEKWGTAHLLESLAEVYVKTAVAQKAVILWGAADALREGISAPMPADDQAEQGQSLEQALASLGEESFQTAWDEGRSLNWEQAIDYALSRNQ